MMRCLARIFLKQSVCTLVLLIKCVDTIVYVTAYNGTAVSQQQPLTIGCNYTKDTSDVVILFRWNHGSTAIVSGSVSAQTVGFQDGLWSSGVFLGDYSSSLTIQLPASSVNTSVDGQYSCIVETLTQGVQDTATATIYRLPSIFGFPSTNQVVESSNLQINCSSYTTQGRPSETFYKWTYGGLTVRSQSVLDITNIKRDEAGEYTCTVNNTVGSASETVNIDIQYAPQIDGLLSPEQIRESSSLIINCSSYTTPGNPSTTNYRWTGPHSYTSTGPVLSISSISRTQTGQYTCTASNTLTPTGGPSQSGTDTGQILVDVQYLDRPQIKMQNIEVLENESVNITCATESSPTARIVIRNIDNNTVLAQEYTDNLRHVIRQARCLHNGSIICSAENNVIGILYSITKDLNVWCSPRPDDRYPFIQEISSDVNQDVSFVVRVIANPIPVFSWYKYIDDKLIQIPNATVHTATSTALNSTLQIKLQQKDDYGSYAVRVRNKYGNLQLMFKLSSVPPMSTPTVERLGKGIGIGVAITLPVILGLFVALAVTLKKLRKKDKGESKVTENEMAKAEPNEDVRSTYTDLSREPASGNEYEQLQTPVQVQGSSCAYQNVSDAIV